MRTIPEIVADMKALVAELEQHTGLPPKKNDTITFSFDNMNSGIPISHYENMGAVGAIGITPTETTTIKF